MLRSLLPSALLLFLACEPQSTASPGIPEDREMGAVASIYPHLAGSGNWYLEYRLSGDTVYVDYAAAQAMARDGTWKDALTSRRQVFYDNGRDCMYTKAVSGCLAFLRGPDLP